MKCTIASRLCRRNTCRRDYDPEKEGIHFWSKETCFVDEVGYSFLNKIVTMKCSFSAFCKDMTKTYRQYNRKTAPFVSVPTFVSYFFSWGAAFQFDFRDDVDPFCGHAPTMLACDGTHVGVSLKQLNVHPINKAEEPRRVGSRHKRHDRILLHQRPGYSARDLMTARTCLKTICAGLTGGLDVGGRDSGEYLDGDDTDDILTIPDHLTHDLEIQQLVALCAEDVRPIVLLVIGRKLSNRLLAAVADVLHVLSFDNPISALMPYADLGVVTEKVRTLMHLQQGQQPPNLKADLETMPEVRRLLDVAARTRCKQHRDLVYGFVLHLVDRIRHVHAEDAETVPADPIEGSYDPSRGVAYYFTRSGEQVRKLPEYTINDNVEKNGCEKKFLKHGRGGYSSVFLWFCPVHGHCYGGHLISGSEGRKDPFASMFRYKPTAPDVIFYDFACQLSEYSLNREPGYFRETRYYHDVFHSWNHVCAKTFKSRRVPSLRVNSEICEQFNARLQCIKFTGTHLSQPRFMFLLQLVMHFWNAEKTEAFRKRLGVFQRTML